MSPENPEIVQILYFNREGKSGAIKPVLGGNPIHFTILDVVMIRRMDGKLFLSSERKRRPQVFPTLRVVFCLVYNKGKETLRLGPFNVWKHLGGKGSFRGQGRKDLKSSLTSVKRRRKERRSERQENKVFYIETE